jgi:hypothetical protein
VWQRLVAGLGGAASSGPTAGALTKARRRLGAKPLRFLFDLLRGPGAAALSTGVCWRGLLVCAIDGTIMAVPDSAANLVVFTKQAGGPCGGSSYPSLRLLALVACGTRTVIDAVFGSASKGETTYAPQLLPSMRRGMIVLADRNFAARELLAQVAATGAEQGNCVWGRWPSCRAALSVCLTRHAVVTCRWPSWPAVRVYARSDP